MPTLCRSYPTEGDARAAVARLLAAGASQDAIRVLMSETARDARSAPLGRFAGDTAIAAGGRS